MRVNTIRLENYRGFRDISVNFDPHFNALVGANGCGKSSLLTAVSESFLGLTQYLNMPSHQPLREPNLARLEVTEDQGRLRFEPTYPISVDFDGDAFGTPLQWSVSKKSQIDGAPTEGISPGQIMQSMVGTKSPDLPVLLFYRASRHWTQSRPSDIQAAMQKDSRTDGLANSWDAAIDSVALQIWIIAKSLERYQFSSETGQPFESISNDELALVNIALATACEDVKGLRYDNRQKSILIEWNLSENISQRLTPFENLSDGQRVIISIIADIARRMCVLNPQLGMAVTQKTSGIVLIDELDIHLHPRWQRNIANGLKAAFPSVQFIVATHSPQVLSELHPNEIILLRPEGVGHPRVSYGLDSSTVLAEIMDASSRPVEIEQDIQTLFTTIEHSDLEAARQQLEKLKKRAPDIPEISGAEALLKRKMVLGR